MRDLIWVNQSKFKWRARRRRREQLFKSGLIASVRACWRGISIDQIKFLRVLSRTNSLVPEFYLSTHPRAHRGVCAFAKLVGVDRPKWLIISRLELTRERESESVGACEFPCAPQKWKWKWMHSSHTHTAAAGVASSLKWPKGCPR